MKYISTRGMAPELPFDEVALAGLAEDGGLYVPKSWPEFSAAELTNMAQLDYPSLAMALLRPFVAGSLDDTTLQRCIDKAYASFRHTAIAPLVQLAPQEWVLELFHGPTLAFKDFALQLLGHVLDAILEKRDQDVTIIGATSGDTGSAAIAGCRGRSRMRIFILHPHNRVSDVQRRQMTTVPDSNVHNIALKGSFDDCQQIVKGMFGDAAFRKSHHLTAVNSINWARIMAQVVYYFYAALALGAPSRAVRFCVPTGNFGDVYAGYVAQKMGLPMAPLLVATNQNDIVPRFLASGTYSRGEVFHTIAPSMDIQVASNFERLLFDLHGRDGAAVRAHLDGFAKTGTLSVSAAQLQQAQRYFDGASVTEDAIRATIGAVHRESQYVLDPHTAIAVHAGRQHRTTSEALVHLSTAHPAKFPDAVAASCGISPALPAHMAHIMDDEERYEIMDNDEAAIRSYIETTV